MLVIHAVKAFHHHPTPVPGKQTSQDAFVPALHQPVHHCIICDYQLAKDAGTATAQFSFEPDQNAVEVYAYYAATFNAVHSSDLNLRGPPAIS